MSRPSLHGSGALVRQTALEVLRQPFTLLVLLTVYALMALLPFLINHTLGEGQKLIRDSGLSLIFVSGILLGAYGSCSTLTREIHRGTAAAVLSKPIGRTRFFLAKFGGIAVAMGVYTLALVPALLLSVLAAAPAYHINWSAEVPLLLILPGSLLLAALINFRWQRPYSSHAIGLLLLLGALALAFGGRTDLTGRAIPLAARLDPGILQAVFALLLAILICSAISVSLATRFDVVPTLSITTVVFMAGLASEYLFGRLTGDHLPAWIPFALFPNWQHFWLADALSRPPGIPGGYLVTLSGYALLYAAAVLSLGVAAFHQMDVRT